MNITASVEGRCGGEVSLLPSLCSHFTAHQLVWDQLWVFVCVCVCCCVMSVCLAVVLVIITASVEGRCWGEVTVSLFSFHSSSIGVISAMGLCLCVCVCVCCCVMSICLAVVLVDITASVEGRCGGEVTVSLFSFHSSSMWVFSLHLQLVPRPLHWQSPCQHLSPHLGLFSLRRQQGDIYD